MPAPEGFRLHTTAQRGRLTDAEKRRLETKLPKYQVTETWLKTPPQNLEVELGMGNGLALLQRAKAEPQRHYLGCELYQSGIATCLYRIGEASNVSLYNGDARDLLSKLPNHSVNRLLLPHPDPWPKARHHKRRLLQNDFLDQVHRVLKSDGESAGEFWFITDWPDYAQQAEELLKLREDFETKVVPQPNWWAETKYQQKAQKAGRSNTYIIAKPL